MTMKTVTFCGHSSMDIGDREHIANKLKLQIEQLILSGATEFLLGGYGEFDLLCAKTVKMLKAKYPSIKSVLVIPYLNRDFDKSIYDCTEYPPIEKTPPRYAIIKRNEYMINKSDVVISYIRRKWGGAYKTYQYALKKDKIVIEV